MSVLVTNFFDVKFALCRTPPMRSKTVAEMAFNMPLLDCSLSTYQAIYRAPVVQSKCLLWSLSKQQILLKVSWLHDGQPCRLTPQPSPELKAISGEGFINKLQLPELCYLLQWNRIKDFCPALM